MMGPLRFGSFAAGGYLWFSPDSARMALADGLGSLGPIVPALPGLLILLGTALLGLTFIFVTP